MTYRHRIAFDVWVNDVRNEALPFDNWPGDVLDDKTVDGIMAALDVQSEAGYNAVDLAGLLSTYAWPVKIENVATADRRRRVNQILDAIHAHGMKAICFPAGVLSWGFDEVIRHDPAVRTDSPRLMNPLREEAWQWQFKVFDYVMDNYDIDGIHLESADQGRSKTKECLDKWPNDVAYHSYVTGRLAEHIRTRRPDLMLTAILLGWSEWGRDFTEEEKGLLFEFSKSVDCIFDMGHRQPYVSAESRRGFIRNLHCAYGTSGGVWVYPPQRWDRLRWFLPYPIRTGTHIRELYEDGGQGLMFYQGPVQNPSTEMNIAVGGRVMLDTDREVEDVLSEVVESLYKPRNTAALGKLVDAFHRCENLYFNQWPDECLLEYGGHTIAPKQLTPPPGEVHLTTLLGITPGPAIYLAEPFLDKRGRADYKRGLMEVSKNLSAIVDDCDDGGRIQRILTCLGNTMLDLNNIGMANDESEVWKDSPQTWEEWT